MDISEQRIREIIREEIGQLVAVAYIRPNIANPKGDLFITGEVMTIQELERRKSEKFSEAHLTKS